MSTKKSRLTVADVASAANVSKATAARVLGGYGLASETARKAVLEAAERLGYQPNDLARSMSTGRSGLIGVVVGDIENAFFSLAVRGISDTARAAGLNVIISNSSEQITEEREMVSVLLRQRVAGLIVAPTDARQLDHLKSAITSGVPVVTLDRWSPDLPADAVCGDDRASAISVLQHLQGAGHRHVAYVTAMTSRSGRLAAPEDVGISAVRERIEGFLAASDQAGIPPPRQMVFTNATDDAATGRIVDKVLAESPRITALLASDSLVGARLFRALTNRGVRLPRDMSLVSWFDADWTRVTSPQISVVDQPTYLFGQRAAERLIRRLKGDTTEPLRLLIPTPLIDRGTVGPAPRCL
ncbi:LacI family DNA-binding transcriptional regulator [Pseudooceanicola sediminis]|nr:LacI family DNA-binding transcriptional regulator [Pseudooceanicola sediminis]|tara:strand:+ start:12116 stop:13183 length:1068 start_codon:yes stop_codon:yes gene_type:complete